MSWVPGLELAAWRTPSPAGLSGSSPLGLAIAGFEGPNYTPNPHVPLTSKQRYCSMVLSISLTFLNFIFNS